MRFTKALVTLTALGAMTFSGIATATAASAQAPVASNESVTPLTVNNLGLTTAEAKNLQCWLRTYWGYTGAIDGLLGPESWKAFQRTLQTHWGYTGPIDGIVGPGTISALQRGLATYNDYTGPIDGIAGPQTQAALKRAVNAINYC